MGRSSGRSSAPARRPPPPAPARQAPPPSNLAAAGQQPQQSLLGSLGSTMVSGLAWGTGTSIARHGVDAMLGGGSSSAPAPAPQQQQQQQMRGPCDIDSAAFMQCVQANPGNVGNCEVYMQALQTCQQNQMYR